MKNRRPIVTAAAVLAISAVAGSTLAEGASTPTPAALARQLAARVATARTNAARYQAVLDMIRDLHRINSHIVSAGYPIIEAAGLLRDSRIRPEKKSK